MALSKRSPMMQLFKILVFAAIFFGVAAAFQQTYNGSLVPASAGPKTKRPRLAKIDYWTAALLLILVPVFLLGGTAFVSAVVAGFRLAPQKGLFAWA